ncbi:MAG: HPr family phosphocarrier protein [Oscillibacter sp.]|jgi:phosphocarrier protein|nr:HPr family phosphocarrier protein [Oscillibacter sp.]
MKQFQYTVSDPMGIHARPAGLLVKVTKPLDSTITIQKADGKSAQSTKLMAVMGLAIKAGNTVTVTVEGGNEEDNFRTIQQFFQENL